ncbi:hypothetical protein BJ878DRAFT_69305 [Calycina marina]|uniref:Chitin-binding type-1 domain-containing protein n=1 Tax=Calycina marina TaxID=1763456 RepID=A0A9P8CGH0_9HELO|nr:hypothetical protein BJ878DRAFT_69305 [Calycina marina]
MRLFITSLLGVPALAGISHNSFTPTLALRVAAATSTDGNCGSNSDDGATCLTSTFGDCCSSHGFCGEDSDFCGEGCQTGFGTCLSSTPGAQVVSSSGSCGATDSANITCVGSQWGNCCSALGYCGGNSSYCDTGCQSTFGDCGSAVILVSTSSTASLPTLVSQTSKTLDASTPTSASAMSTSGNCGTNSATLESCLGSTFGDCCSSLGYCGENASYCETGCQLNWGACGVSSSNSSNSTQPAAFLSTGTKAGIGIAAAAVGLAAVGLLIWYVLSRRKSPKCGAMNMEGGNYADFEFQDSHNSVLHSTTPAREEARTELSGEPRKYELGVMLPVEMAADNVWSKKDEQMRREWVDNRVAAGYDGAYRGN